MYNYVYKDGQWTNIIIKVPTRKILKDSWRIIYIFTKTLNISWENFGLVYCIVFYVIFQILCYDEKNKLWINIFETCKTFIKYSLIYFTQRFVFQCRVIKVFYLWILEKTGE